MARKRRQLKMRVNFEPTRLSDDFIARAYEQILPLVRLKNKQSSTTTNGDEEHMTLINDEVI